MKKTGLFICLFFIENTMIAQDVKNMVLKTDFDCQKINQNEYRFDFHTYFGVGSSGSCPKFVNYTVSTEKEVLKVNAYYDISGTWPPSNCDLKDIVIYKKSIPNTIRYIQLSTNIIAHNETPAYNNLYTKMFPVSSLTNPKTSKCDFFNSTNPSQGNVTINMDFKYLKIINEQGQEIKQLDKNTSGKYDLKDIQQGTYYLMFYDLNDKELGSVKIQKKN